MTLQVSDNSDEVQESSKYLTFELANEHYGVDILRVREIIGLLDITPIPNTPEYTKGVINLRGKIIPVMDLRMKFGVHVSEFTEETCIIVVEIEGADSQAQTHIGVIVDTVSDVLDVPDGVIEPTPKYGTVGNTEFIRGLGKTEIAGTQQVLIILDIDKAIADSSAEGHAITDELTLTQSITSQNPGQSDLAA